MDAAAASEAGRLLAGMRRRRAKVCPECQESFVATGKQLYCDPKCSKRRWWRENRGAGTPQGLAQVKQLELGIEGGAAMT